MQSWPRKAVSRRPGFKTNMQPIVSARQSLDRSLDRQRAVLNLPEKPDFSRPAPFRDRNGVLLLGDVESHESFAILSHGPPSVHEARLGNPSNPRSYLHERAGHRRRPANMTSRFDNVFEPDRAGEDHAGMGSQERLIAPFRHAAGGIEDLRDLPSQRTACALRQMVQGGGAELLTP